MLAPSGGGLILYQAYGNLYAMPGIQHLEGIWRKYNDLGSFGEETDKATDLHQHCSRISPQKLETASQITRDAVTIPTTTASQDIATTSARTIQPII
ncbi:hypothetical protein Tco_0019139 [Tanacetum coccineum]